MIRVRLDKYVNRHHNKVLRLVWEIVWRVFGATTPRWTLQGWRRELVKLFGGKMGFGVQVHGGARIWYPANLRIGKYSWVGDHANLYCVDKIRIGAHAVISEGAYICTAEHDIADAKFELKTAPIEIGDNAWIGARAIVLPGRKIGEGAVVAAGAVVTKDVEPWTVVAGNPARVVRKREVVVPQADISVIILAKNEIAHIKRCLERLAPLNPKNVFIVDCFSDDGSVELAERTASALGLNLKVVQHAWPGLYAAQYNWAGKNLPIDTKWVLRLDADEYLYDNTIDEIQQKLARLSEDVTGVVFKRRHVVGWLGNRWVKRGMYPVKLLRLYRQGCGICEERYMDEHIKLSAGRSVEFDGDFADHNLNSFEWWKEKHRGYAKREAHDAIEIMARLKAHDMSEFERGAVIGRQAVVKRRGKYKYYSLPPYFRVVIYWATRFFLKGAVFEGLKAWRWCWYHALWYRWQCDREIGKLIREGK